MISNKKKYQFFNGSVTIFFFTDNEFQVYDYFINGIN